VKFGGLSSQGLQKPEKRRYDGGTRTPGPPISENPGKRDPEQPRAHTGYKAWFRGARMPADQRELIHESRAEIEGHEERKRRRQSPDVCLSSRPPPAGLVVALDPLPLRHLSRSSVVPGRRRGRGERLRQGKVQGSVRRGSGR
jgi:hypothetical protein